MSNIRALSRIEAKSAARKKATQKTVVIGLATAIMAGLFAPAASAATTGTTQTAPIVTYYETAQNPLTFEDENGGTFVRDSNSSRTTKKGNKPYKATAAEQKIIDALTASAFASDDSKDRASSDADMAVSGSVELEIDASALTALKAAGINIDVAKSQEKTNAYLETDFGQRNPDVLLVLTFDEAKLTTSAGKLGFESYDVANLVALLKDGTEWLPNIASDKVAGDPGFRKGQTVPDSSFPVASTLDDLVTGWNSEFKAYAVAGLAPVASVTSGGTRAAGWHDDVEAGKTSVYNTTVTDLFADGDSAKRLADVSMGGKVRGLDTANMANCLKEECGVWFTPTMSGMDADGNPSTKVLADPFRIHVHSTVSAGKTPAYTKANPLVLESGDKLWLEQKAPAHMDDTDYADAKDPILPFYGYAELQKQLKAASPENVDLTAFRVGMNSTAFVDFADNGNKITTTTRVSGDDLVVDFTAATPVTNWTQSVDGERMALTVGKVLDVGFTNARITKVSPTGFTAVIVDGADIENVETGSIAASINVNLGSLAAHQNSGYELKFIKAPVKDIPEISIIPDEPVKPKPVVVTPAAVKDFAKGAYGAPVSIALLPNDAPNKGWKVDVSSLAMTDPATGKFVKSVSIKGQGTYVIKGEAAVFTPVDGFSGKATALTYRWTQVNTETGVRGATATATLQAEIAPKKDEPKDVPEISIIPDDPKEEITTDEEIVEEDSDFEEDIVEEEISYGGVAVPTGGLFAGLLTALAGFGAFMLGRRKELAPVEATASQD